MAGLTFGSIGSGQDMFNISGPQFDMDPDRAKRVSYLFLVADTPETIYTVPTGKVFYLTGMAMTNEGAGNSMWFIRIDGVKIYEESIAANTTSTVEYTNPIPIKAKESITGDVDLVTGDTGIVLMGWEQ